MAMKPQIQMGQNQSLAMTPQLQQAIKLLQLSNIELATFVEEQLESNPLLERGTSMENRRDENAAPETIDSESALEELDLSMPNRAAIDALDVSERLLDTDATVADLVPDAPSAGGEIDWSRTTSGGLFAARGDYDAAANTARELTLSEHLKAQIAMTFHDERESLIATYLVDHADENGYFRATPQDIANRLGVSTERVASVLTVMQGFEPTGVMARSLSECLSLQLAERGELDKPMRALLANLELLASHDLQRLMKLCGLGTEELATYAVRLRTLAPKPGLAYGSDVAAVVEPDVLVREIPDSGWAIELNSDTLPRVLVNSRYFAEVCDHTNNEKVKAYMSGCQKNALWLVKSLDQRARTILKVSSEIVKQQNGFFAYGVDQLRPLNLKTVADAIEMHESTVSRASSNKYMATPRGMFELKYFFTSTIGSTDGSDAHSAKSVRHKIKTLIDGEQDTKSVLSDDKIVTMLNARGINIARRTVAKYRESLGIRSSVHRRQVFRNKASVR